METYKYLENINHLEPFCNPECMCWLELSSILKKQMFLLFIK